MTTTVTGIAAELRLETAAFIRDLSKASQAVAANTTAMHRSMNRLQTGFQSAANAAKGFVGAFAAAQLGRTLVRLGANAIQVADEIGEASTRIGIGSEQLQKFRFAAAQADVETEQLDTALRMFAKNLATGKITAHGKDLADTFQNYIQQIAKAPSFIEKTRLAQEAFSKQWQVAILLASQGAEEFKRQSEEAFTRSAQAIAAASNLDNQLRALTNAAQAGFDTGFIEAFIGKTALTRSDLEEVNRIAFQVGQTVAESFRRGISVVTEFRNVIREVNTFFQPIADILNTMTGINGRPGALPGLSFEGMQSGLASSSIAAAEAIDVNAKALDAQTAAMKRAGEEFSHMAGLQLELYNTIRTPMEQYEAQLARISAAQLNAADTAKLQGMAQMELANKWLGAASAVSGSLAALFKENKAVAIANAVINTAEAITAALKNPPGPPFSYVYAAAAAVAGAAQIATIMSAQPGSSKAIRAPKGGSASARAGAASNGGGGGASLQQAVTIHITGESFGPTHFRRLVTGLNGVIADGARLNVVNAR